MKETTPEIRNEWIRKHLKQIEEEGGLLKELVAVIVASDNGKVTYLARKIAKMIGNPAKEIERLKNKISELEKENKRLTGRANGISFREEGEAFENIGFVDRVKIIFRLIFGRIKKVKIFFK